MKSELSEIGAWGPDCLTGEIAGIKPDLPPEYCHYRDEGCELAESCLECPLPQCIYDQPRGRQRWLKAVRDKAVVGQFLTGGKGVKELSLMFGISQRTVQRILKKVRNG